MTPAENRHRKPPRSAVEALRSRAETVLPGPVSEFFGQGAGAGVSAAEATQRWDRLRLRPRVLTNVSTVSTAARVLGHDLPSPILVAPTTLQRMAHPDGEVATARAVAAQGSLMCVSSNAGSTFEDIAATGVRWWLQVYVLRDRGLTTAILQRGREAGASAVVLTADTPVVGRKAEAGESVWSIVPDEFVLANADWRDLPENALDKADDLTPDTIGWLHEVTGLPVVLKGVLRGDDARTVAQAGAAAVYVSNHGGRQLDLAAATVDVLPEVADAVAGTVEVYADGGIRRAEHVLAALALGADAVFVGRPVLWALAAGGSDAVARLLAGLTDDLDHALRLAGARNLDEVTADLVRPYLPG